MSELKAYNVVATADVNPEVVDILGCTEWLGYDKDEADKVIADKDAEITQLQAMLEERNKQVGELKKERDWLAKDRAQAYDDLEKRAQLNIKQESEIAELKKQVHDYAQGLYVLQARAEKEARHQKYKRCLAMARVCYNQREIYLRDSYNWELENSEKAYLRKKAEIIKKRHKRWLELAEKFKEAK